MGPSSELAFRAQLIVPEQRQLYDYWVSRARGRRMPSREDISPADFGRLLPNVSLIDVDAVHGRFRVRLAGTRLRDIYDREVTGKYLDELDWGDKTDYWISAYRRVVDNSRPAQGIVRGPRKGKDHLVQFWLRLPLSFDGKSVSMILCYDSFVPTVHLETMPGRNGEIARVATAGNSTPW
jgi:hypothetical protein